MPAILHVISTDEDTPWKSFKVQSNISEHTGSSESFQYVSKLLQTCLKTHYYRRDSQRSPLSRRVLDLRDLTLGPTLNDTTVKLYETTGEGAAYVFVSLLGRDAAPENCSRNIRSP